MVAAGKISEPTCAPCRLFSFASPQNWSKSRLFYGAIIPNFPISCKGLFIFHSFATKRARRHGQNPSQWAKVHIRIIRIACLKRKPTGVLSGGSGCKQTSVSGAQAEGTCERRGGSPRFRIQSPTAVTDLACSSAKSSGTWNLSTSQPTGGSPVGFRMTVRLGRTIHSRPSVSD